MQTPDPNSNSVWAVLELFGHTTVAGRLTKPPRPIQTEDEIESPF